MTTTFWIGERPAKNNPVPNHASSWDPKWAEHFGGTDDPDRANRSNCIPASFVPQQNPFYIALPYNDILHGDHKPEASQVVPWFKKAYQGPGKSVLKGRWVAIRFGNRTVYAQWEDCGPFRTDHWQYVFGNERPKPNLNRGAGLDVSPAVRDYLGMNDTDVTDWRFVEFEEVPRGPWANFGDNNTFVINQRAQQQRLAKAQPTAPKVNPVSGRWRSKGSVSQRDTPNQSAAPPNSIQLSPPVQLGKRERKRRTAPRRTHQIRPAFVGFHDGAD